MPALASRPCLRARLVLSAQRRVFQPCVTLRVRPPVRPSDALPDCGMRLTASGDGGWLSSTFPPTGCVCVTCACARRAEISCESRRAHAAFGWRALRGPPRVEAAKTAAGAALCATCSFLGVWRRCGAAAREYTPAVLYRPPSRYSLTLCALPTWVSRLCSEASSSAVLNDRRVCGMCERRLSRRPSWVQPMLYRLDSEGLQRRLAFPAARPSASNRHLDGATEIAQPAPLTDTARANTVTIFPPAVQHDARLIRIFPAVC